MHEKAWAVVLQVSIPQGFLYFKDSRLGGRYEPGLVTAPAQRSRDWVPEPLAHRPMVRVDATQTTGDRN